MRPGYSGARLLRFLLTPAWPRATAQDVPSPVVPQPEAPTPVAQASPPTLRITVTMVQADAVVTNSNGRHVAGLQKEDFEILQDGEPRKLTYFVYVAAPHTLAAAA